MDDDDIAENPPRNDPGSNSKTVLSFAQAVIPLIIAVAVLYIFWMLVKTMMGKTGATELEWNRAAYVFAGVEAIAYAAAGFLFGREVHRQRAEQAEQRAGTERQRASTAERKAVEETTKGKTLRQVIDAKKSRQEQVQVLAFREDSRQTRRPASHEHMQDEGLETFRITEPSSARGDDIDELSRVASQLFP